MTGRLAACGLRLAVGRRTALVVTMLVLLVVPAVGAELEVKARIEPAGPYHVGDRLKFVWEVQHDAKVKVESDLAGPLAAALHQGGFEAAGVPPTATTTGAEEVAPMPRVVPAPGQAPAGRVHTVLSAPVTMFTTGVHRVAPVTVEYRDAAGAAQKVSTPEMVVPVQSVLKDGKSEARDVKAPVPYPFHFHLPAWAWAVLVALFGAVVWLVMRRRPVKAVVVPPPPPADAEAFSRIEALMRENLIKLGHVKEFCDRVSDILRHYLGRRFGLASMGDTSYELLQALEVEPRMTGEDRNQLATFLEACDLAKFAKAQPDEHQLLGLVESARGLVTRTYAPAVTPPGEVRPPSPDATAPQGGVPK